MSIMEKAAGLVNRRPGGVVDHASRADQAPDNNTPVPLQLDAFDADGQISADLIPYGAAADRVLVRDKAERALAAAVSIEQVKQIHDLAIGMLAYAKKASDHDLEADAAEIRMKATRRLGEMMRAQKETVGLNEGGRPAKTGLAKNPVSEPPTLDDVGIDKNLAHQARTAAAMSEPEFGQAVADKRDSVGKKKLKARSDGAQEDAINVAVNQVQASILRALRRIEPGRYARLQSSLHRLIDKLVKSESKAKEKAKAKPREAKPKPRKSKRTIDASDVETAASRSSPAPTRSPSASASPTRRGRRGASRRSGRWMPTGGSAPASGKCGSGNVSALAKPPSAGRKASSREPNISPCRFRASSRG